jgi:hypothetical protein
MPLPDRAPSCSPSVKIASPDIAPSASGIHKLRQSVTMSGVELCALDTRSSKPEPDQRSGRDSSVVPLRDVAQPESARRAHRSLSERDGARSRIGA